MKLMHTLNTNIKKFFVYLFIAVFFTFQVNSQMVKAMNIDNFRYDASELMPRPVGAKYLWQFFFKYIGTGGDRLVQLINDLDKKF